MKHGKSFILVAALTVCATISAQDATNVDSLQQVLEQQRSLMEQQEARLAALEQAENMRSENEGFDKIWKQHKQMNLGIGSQKLRNLDDEEEPVKKSSIAISLQMGKTFNLHKKPIANMVRIGLDWNYIEMNFAKYKKLTIEDFEWGGYSSRSSFDDDDDYYGSLGDLGLSDFGYYQIDYGMALGPSVQVTPFYTIGKGLEYIKAYTYFHVIPSFSGILLSGNDETDFGYGYVTNFSWGIGISYRSFAIGFETRWGSGKYDMSAINDEINEDLIYDGLGGFLQGGDKVKYKTTSSKFVISLRF